MPDPVPIIKKEGAEIREQGIIRRAELQRLMKAGRRFACSACLTQSAAQIVLSDGISRVDSHGTSEMLDSLINPPDLHQRSAEIAICVDTIIINRQYSPERGDPLIDPPGLHQYIA